MSLVFDSSDFDKKFKNIVEHAIPTLVERGVGRAALQFLNDAIMTVPTCPLKQGWLRGSGSVFVQNKLTSVSQAGKPGMANTTHVDPIGPKEFIGVVGFNAPYAARMHEGITFKFTEPSSGPKYLESKLHRNKDTYAKIIANTIKEGGR